MSWHTKVTGGYTSSSAEGRDNATEIANTLIQDNWEIKSICALLGNGAGESGLNPWRWESDYVPTYSEFLSWDSSQSQTHGYGLFQFTPASKYINSQSQSMYGAIGYAPNFSDIQGGNLDGNAQVAFFNTRLPNDWLGGLYNYYASEFAAIGVDISDFYYMSLDDFKSGNYSLRDLVGAFELKFERPAASYAASSFNNRVSQANAWYTYFQEHPPTPTLRKRRRYKFYLYG